MARKWRTGPGIILILLLLEAIHVSARRQTLGEKPLAFQNKYKTDSLVEDGWARRSQRPERTTRLARSMPYVPFNTLTFAAVGNSSSSPSSSSFQWVPTVGENIRQKIANSKLAGKKTNRHKTPSTSAQANRLVVPSASLPSPPGSLTVTHKTKVTLEQNLEKADVHNQTSAASTHTGYHHSEHLNTQTALKYDAASANVPAPTQNEHPPLITHAWSSSSRNVSAEEPTLFTWVPQITFYPVKASSSPAISLPVDRRPPDTASQSTVIPSPSHRPSPSDSPPNRPHLSTRPFPTTSPTTRLPHLSAWSYLPPRTPPPARPPATSTWLSPSSRPDLVRWPYPSTKPSTRSPPLLTTATATTPTSPVATRSQLSPIMHFSARPTVFTITLPPSTRASTAPQKTSSLGLVTWFPAYTNPSPVTTPSPATLPSRTPRPATPRSTTTPRSTISWPITFWPTIPWPTTPRPTTPSPITSPPTTPPSTTPRPTTSPPTTPRPTTSPPTTPPSTTPRPTTSPPTTLKSATSLPTTPRPTTSPSTTLKPTTSPLTTSPSTTSWPTTPRPTISPPTTLRPTTSPPIISLSTYPRPATPRPTTSPPTTSPSTTSWPTTPRPTTSPPTIFLSTYPRPTTSRPTTSPPTTLKLTTSPPTTFPSTTSWPSTPRPTTSPPTISLSTYLRPTTLRPTTSPPTTSRPTTTRSTTPLTTTPSSTTAPRATPSSPRTPPATPLLSTASRVRFSPVSTTKTVSAPPSTLPPTTPSSLRLPPPTSSTVSPPTVNQSALPLLWTWRPTYRPVITQSPSAVPSSSLSLAILRGDTVTTSTQSPKHSTSSLLKSTTVPSSQTPPTAALDVYHHIITSIKVPEASRPLQYFLNHPPTDTHIKYDEEELLWFEEGETTPAHPSPRPAQATITISSADYQMLQETLNDISRIQEDDLFTYQHRDTVMPRPTANQHSPGSEASGSKTVEVSLSSVEHQGGGEGGGPEHGGKDSGESNNGSFFVWNDGAAGAFPQPSEAQTTSASTSVTATTFTPITTASTTIPSFLATHSVASSSDPPPPGYGDKQSSVQLSPSRDQNKTRDRTHFPHHNTHAFATTLEDNNTSEDFEYDVYEDGLSEYYDVYGNVGDEHDEHILTGSVPHSVSPPLSPNLQILTWPYTVAPTSRSPVLLSPSPLPPLSGMSEVNKNHFQILTETNLSSYDGVTHIPSLQTTRLPALHWHPSQLFHHSSPHFQFFVSTPLSLHSPDSTSDFADNSSVHTSDQPVSEGTKSGVSSGGGGIGGGSGNSGGSAHNFHKLEGYLLPSLGQSLRAGNITASHQSQPHPHPSSNAQGFSTTLLENLPQSILPSLEANQGNQSLSLTSESSYASNVPLYDLIPQNVGFLDVSYYAKEKSAAVAAITTTRRPPLIYVPTHSTGGFLGRPGSQGHIGVLPSSQLNTFTPLNPLRPVSSNYMGQSNSQATPSSDLSYGFSSINTPHRSDSHPHAHRDFHLGHALPSVSTHVLDFLGSVMNISEVTHNTANSTMNDDDAAPHTPFLAPPVSHDTEITVTASNNSLSKASPQEAESIKATLTATPQRVPSPLSSPLSASLQSSLQSNTTTYSPSVVFSSLQSFPPSDSVIPASHHHPSGDANAHISPPPPAPPTLSWHTGTRNGTTTSFTVGSSVKLLEATLTSTSTAAFLTTPASLDSHTSVPLPPSPPPAPLSLPLPLHLSPQFLPSSPPSSPPHRTEPMVPVITKGAPVPALPQSHTLHFFPTDAGGSRNPQESLSDHQHHPGPLSVLVKVWTMMEGQPLLIGELYVPQNMFLNSNLTDGAVVSPQEMPSEVLALVAAEMESDVPLLNVDLHSTHRTTRSVPRPQSLEKRTPCLQPLVVGDFYSNGLSKYSSRPSGPKNHQQQVTKYPSIPLPAALGLPYFTESSGPSLPQEGDPSLLKSLHQQHSEPRPPQFIKASSFGSSITLLGKGRKVRQIQGLAFPDDKENIRLIHLLIPQPGPANKSPGNHSDSTETHSLNQGKPPSNQPVVKASASPPVDTFPYTVKRETSVKPAAIGLPQLIFGGVGNKYLGTPTQFTPPLSQDGRTQKPDILPFIQHFGGVGNPSHDHLPLSVGTTLREVDFARLQVLSRLINSSVQAHLGGLGLGSGNFVEGEQHHTKDDTLVQALPNDAAPFGSILELLPDDLADVNPLMANGRQQHSVNLRPMLATLPAPATLHWETLQRRLTALTGTKTFLGHLGNQGLINHNHRAAQNSVSGYQGQQLALDRPMVKGFSPVSHLPLSSSLSTSLGTPILETHGTSHQPLPTARPTLSPIHLFATPHPVDYLGSEGVQMRLPAHSVMADPPLPHSGSFLRYLTRRNFHPSVHLGHRL